MQANKHLIAKAVAWVLGLDTTKGHVCSLEPKVAKQLPSQTAFLDLLKVIAVHNPNEALK